MDIVSVYGQNLDGLAYTLGISFEELMTIMQERGIATYQDLKDIICNNQLVVLWSGQDDRCFISLMRHLGLEHYIPIAMPHRAAISNALFWHMYNYPTIRMLDGPNDN